MSSQGRHVKTGQLAAIKVMDVTEVRLHISLFQLDIKCDTYCKDVQMIPHFCWTRQQQENNCPESFKFDSIYFLKCAQFF